MEFTNNYKETPVIFGLLDQNDTTHYIKINRGYLGPGDALEFAKIADSNYFENVYATITEYIDGVQSGEPIELIKDTLNNKSTDGIFFGPEHYAYRFDKVLNPEATYRLYVNINEGTVEVVGETNVVDGVGLSSNINKDHNSLKFYNDQNEGAFVPYAIQFSRGTSFVGNATAVIEIAEFRGTDAELISIPWNIEGDVAPDGNDYNVTAQGQNFYETILNGVTDDATITKRRFEGFKFIYTGGNEDLENYIQVNKPSSSLAQTRPNYTNLTASIGFEVIGLFASRQTFVLDKPFLKPGQQGVRSLDKKSTKELCQGTITGNLLFCSQHVGDQGESYKCP